MTRVFSFSARIVVLRSCILGSMVMFCAGAFSQDYRKGYIVKNNGDSVSGLLAYRALNKNFDECSFKTARFHASTKYLPSELKRYGFYGDKQYLSIIRPKSDTDEGGQAFGKILCDGVLKLYGYKDRFYIRRDSALILLPVPTGRMVGLHKNQVAKHVDGTRVVSRVQDEEKFMKDYRYIGILTHFIEDCKLSAMNTTYTETDLANLVNNYNRCKGIAVGKTPVKSSFHVSLKLLAGGLYSNIRVKELPKKSFSPSGGILAGAGFDFSSPRKFDRSYLTVELLYGKIFYQGYAQGNYRGNFRRRDFFVDVSYFKIPVAFKYNFGEANNSTYFKAGMAIFLKQKTKITTVDEQQAPNGIVYTDRYEGGYLIRTAKSIWIAAGVDRPLLGKYGVFLELRIEGNSGFIGDIFSGSNYTTEASVIGGLRF
jgi:hypothetical protein